MGHLADLRAALEGLETDQERATVPATAQDAGELIAYYRGEAYRRMHNDEPFDCALTNLSPDARRYYEGRGVTALFPGPWAANREETA